MQDRFSVVNHITRWEKLVLTDQDSGRFVGVDRRRTLFVSYDAETAVCLEQRGFQVREARLARFQTLDELYEHYASTRTVRPEPRVPQKGMDGDCCVVWEQLRFKAVEVYGPILAVWEETESILSEEPSQTIEIDVANEWLAMVLKPLIEETMGGRIRREPTKEA